MAIEFGLDVTQEEIDSLTENKGFPNPPPAPKQPASHAPALESMPAPEYKTQKEKKHILLVKIKTSLGYILQVKNPDAEGDAPLVLEPVSFRIPRESLRNGASITEYAMRRAFHVDGEATLDISRAVLVGHATVLDEDSIEGDSTEEDERDQTAANNTDSETYAADIYELILDEEKVDIKKLLQQNPRLVLVPFDNMPLRHSLNVHPPLGESDNQSKNDSLDTDFFFEQEGRSYLLHPYYKLVVDGPPVNFEDLEKLDLPKKYEIAKKIISKLEGIENHRDRLTLDLIDSFRHLAVNQKAVDELERAYISTRLSVLGLKQLGHILAEAGIAAGTLDQSSAIRAVFTIGNLLTSVLGGEGGKDTPLYDALFKVLMEILTTYEVNRMGQEGLSDSSGIAQFASLAAQNLSETAAVQSQVAAKWITLVVNSAIISGKALSVNNGGISVENPQTAAVGAAYIGLGLGANLLSGPYKKWLTDKNLPGSGLAKPFLDKAASLAPLLGDLLPAGAPQLVLAIATFLGQDNIKELAGTEDRLNRENIVEFIEDVIEYANTEATSIVSDEKFRRHCAERRRELRQQSLELLSALSPMYSGANSYRREIPNVVQPEEVLINRFNPDQGRRIVYPILSNYLELAEKDRIAKPGEEEIKLKDKLDYLNSIKAERDIIKKIIFIYHQILFPNIKEIDDLPVGDRDIYESLDRQRETLEEIKSFVGNWQKDREKRYGLKSIRSRIRSIFQGNHEQRQFGKIQQLFSQLDKIADWRSSTNVLERVDELEQKIKEKNSQYLPSFRTAIDQIRSTRQELFSGAENYESISYVDLMAQINEVKQRIFELKRDRIIGDRVGVSYPERKDTSVVVFADATIRSADGQISMRRETFGAVGGRVLEIGGIDDERFLEALAARRIMDSGTIYVRTGKEDADEINIHLDEKRDAILYQNCVLSYDHQFFVKNNFEEERQELVDSNFEEVRQKLVDSGLFNEDEIRDLKTVSENTGGAVLADNYIASRKLALIEAFESESTVLVLANLLDGVANPMDQKLMASFVQKNTAEKNKIVIISREPDSDHFRSALRAAKVLDSLLLENTRLQRTSY